MKAIEINRFGTPEDVIECVDTDGPGAPDPNEIVADIEAFPINPADLHGMEGVYAEPPPLPARMGAEAVGTVSAVGDAVQGLRPGDRVMFRCRENWVERRRVPADQVIRLPEALQGDIGPDRVLQAAMLKVNPATAYLLLRDYVQLAPGDWVIQNAANSGVGSHLVRLAGDEGWKTVNVVRSEAAAEAVRGNGGDVALLDGPDLPERVREATGGADIRLGIDALAGDHSLRLADCLAANATLVVYGRLSGEPCRVDPHHFIFRGMTVTGFWLSPALARRQPHEVVALYTDLAGRLAAEALHVPVAATYAMHDIKAAVAHARRGGRAGKILVTP